MPAAPTTSNRIARAVAAALAAVTIAVLASASPAGATPTTPSTPLERVAGRPTSSNGASSMHITPVGGTAPGQRASVVFEVLQQPAVPELYFWALQVQLGSNGEDLGGVHLGLQWDPSRPGSTAVNFGGYDRNGQELVGDKSPLPSANGNVNTRDFEWQARRPYELTVVADKPGWWRGEVTDLKTGTTVVVRRLRSAATELTGVVVWSEVFARCDAPTTSVRWSELTSDARELQITYQDVTDGGCTNTTAKPTSRGIVQRTNTLRTVRAWQTIRLPLAPS